MRRWWRRWRRWQLARLAVSSPAIWGKLPGHADYVRSNCDAETGECWRAWFRPLLTEPRKTGAAVKKQRGGPAWLHLDPQEQQSDDTMPVAFVLPFDQLSFAPRAFVLGVLLMSTDSVGRISPVVIFQTCQQPWLRAMWPDSSSEESGSNQLLRRNWLYWQLALLTRLFAGDVTRPISLPVLSEALATGWRVYVSSWCQVVDVTSTEYHDQTMRSWLDSLAPPLTTHGQRRGVSFLPWPDWPETVSVHHASPTFWQQDDEGGYLHAATSLSRLLHGRP